MVTKFQLILQTILIIAMSLPIQIGALVYSIENKTDGQIHIFLEYEAETLCTPAERIIEKNQTILIKAGPCQARHIIIKNSGHSFEIPTCTGQNKQNCTIIIENRKTESSTFDKCNTLITVSYQK